MNGINSEGATALSDKLLSCARDLNELHLEENDIGDQGAIMIAGNLLANTTLTCLNLTGNLFSQVGLLCFENCLKVNTTITKITLSSLCFFIIMFVCTECKCIDYKAAQDDELSRLSLNLSNFQLRTLPFTIFNDQSIIVCVCVFISFFLLID